MTDKDKPDIRDSGASNESEKTAAHTLISAEDQMLPPHPRVLTNEEANEPTRKFDAPPSPDELESSRKTEFENERTKVLEGEPREDEEGELPSASAAPDKNALPPSRLRSALVVLLFANMFIFTGINIYQVFSIQSSLPFAEAAQGDRIVIVNVRQGFEDAFQVGDELVSVNGIEVNPANVRQLDNLALDEPGERRTIVVRRGDAGQAREIETVSVSSSLGFRLNRILYEILLRTMFLVTGLLIFLFKPNDKQSFLATLIFASALASGSLSISPDLPSALLAVKVVGLLALVFCAPFFLHFCLVFPERSSLLRRFPKLERLIYLPTLLVVVPIRTLLILQFAGYALLDSFSSLTLFQSVGRYAYDLHFVVGLVVLISTYRRAGEVARRRLRVSVVGLLCSLAPFLLNGLIVNPLVRFFEIRNPWQEWMPFIAAAPLLLTPPVAAYAIVRDRVIPISFVIRRGLQYLLAKNVLRLLLILPVLGVAWNVVADPDRTLNEILLQNSRSFYFFVLLAAGLLLLNRFRLREWIDKKFFREQYDQERVLRELTEAVKESDSLPKLSRLVSSKIQLALHPENVYLFYRDDARNSDFSLGYTGSGARRTRKRAKDARPSSESEIQNPKSKIERLAAASPILRFIEQERGTIELPNRKTEDLPAREKRWLRSIGANLLVPMHGTDGKLVGFFSLGEKMSHIPYTTRDKELLETLAHQIALVHENLSLKTRVLQEQKIKAEVLSRFDEGNINLLKECPRCGRCYDRKVEKCASEGAELTLTLPVERTIENRYRLERLLGKGGMGAVYEAADLRLNRAVAVKILSGSMFGNQEALRRFEREAQTAGRLNHNNIVTVYDYGVLSTEGAFLVMEFVRGESLADVLKRKGALDLPTAKVWFAQILDGLEAAHKAGIVHRDLKPDNVLVSQNETGDDARLCILDFGLARLSEAETANIAQSVTVPGTIMGTFGYMPPEQLRGEQTDERSDLFAVAVMIYESLEGEKPFAGKSYHELLTAMSRDAAFDFDAELSTFFERGLAREAENRFATAGEMREALLKLKAE